MYNKNNVRGFFLIEFTVYSSILSVMMFGLILSSLAFHESLSRALGTASNESAGTEILLSLEQEFDAGTSLTMPTIQDLTHGSTISNLESSTTVINSNTVKTFSFIYNNENFSFTKMSR